MMAWKPNVNPDAERFDELRGKLLTRVAEEPAEVPIQIHGKAFIVPISRCENKSTISDPLALYKKLRRLGVEKLLELYTITLTKARKVLTEKEQAKFITTERTGPREIGEPVRKDAAA